MPFYELTYRPWAFHYSTRFYVVGRGLLPYVGREQKKKRDEALAVGALNQLPFSSAEAVTKRENKLTLHLDDDAF